MIQHGGAHAQPGVVQYDAVAQGDRLARFTPKAVLQAKARGCRGVGREDLGHLEPEVGGEALGQVPGVARQALPDRIDDPRRSINAQRLVAADQSAQNLVETDEMVDVHVRHEDIAQTQDLARRQCVQVAEIEQQAAPVEFQFDVDPRVAEGVVHQEGV